MRLSTDEDRDEEGALATIAAAAEAGITVFDTARAYGDNERLLARALRACGAHERARIVTKGGMTRAGGAWVPDGRAKAIRADCEASLAALDGLPIDLYLDPRAGSAHAVADVGARARAARRRRPRPQRRRLERQPPAARRGARARADRGRPGRAQPVRRPRAARRRRRAVRGGRDRGDRALAARRPARAARVGRARRSPRRRCAAARRRPRSRSRGCSVCRPAVVAIPGARRPETARSAARAAALDLDADAAAALTRAFGRPRRRAPRPRAGAEVVLVMGIPGAGKSRVAEEYVARGYVRLNRDERGGSLRELAGRARRGARVAASARVVLDNTYLTRAARSYVIEAAAATGLPSAASGSTRRSRRRR